MPRAESPVSRLPAFVQQEAPVECRPGNVHTEHAEGRPGERTGTTDMHKVQQISRRLLLRQGLQVCARLQHLQRSTPSVQVQSRRWQPTKAGQMTCWPCGGMYGSTREELHAGRAEGCMGPPGQNFTLAVRRDVWVHPGRTSRWPCSIQQAEALGIHCSPFGVIPKKYKAGKF